MSPEERAGAVWDAIEAANAWDYSHKTVAFIASAIREAENAALERAALFCDEEAKLKESAVFADRAFGRREAGRRMGRIIRSLKSQET